MHTKKVTFSSFFTDLQQVDFLGLLKIFGSRLTNKAADIGLLLKICKKADDFLLNTNTYVLITDLKTMRFLYISPSVLNVTGYTQKQFITGGVIQ